MSAMIEKIAHRQPGRDRAAHPARLPRTRHQDRRRPLRGRPRPQARAARRRDRSASGPPPSRGQLSQHPRHHQRGRGHRHGGHPPRLRLPVGERRLRRAGGAQRLHLHRPAPGDHPPDGRQGLGHRGHEGGRRPLRARLRRPAGRRQEAHPGDWPARSAIRSSSRPPAAAAGAACGWCTPRRPCSTPSR